MKIVQLLFVLLSSTSVFGQTTVRFELTDIPTSSFKNVGIRGNGGPLSWEKSLKMDFNGTSYFAELEFESSVSAIQFKYVLYNSAKKVQWESISNRKLEVTVSDHLTVNHQWDKEPAIDLTKLTKIPKSKLLQDYELIKTLILNVHPGTYRYNTKTQVENALAEFKNSVSKDLTHQQAYLAISKVLAQIQCDHTFASYYNQDKMMKQIIHEQKDKLPFTFTWIENEMIVLKNASNAKLPRGTKILKINDIPTSQILKTLMNYVRADGATDGSRRKQLEIDAYPYRYNAFDVFFPLVYDSADAIKLEIERPNTDPELVIVNALTREDRAEILKRKYEEFEFDKSQLWGFEIIESGIGYVKAGTFDDYGIDRDWKKYFTELFVDIKTRGVKSLIVDLRKNQGGFDDIGYGLIAHLIKDKRSVSDYLSKSRYKTFPESLKPFVSSWGDPWYYEHNFATSEPEDGYYILKEDTESIKPAKNAFTGSNYFLVGPSNVSMAYYLASAIKKYKIGQLIGEETGGNQLGINGGQIVFLKLPGSGIEVDFPVEGAFSKSTHLENKGVVPDHVVTRDVQSIIESKDLQLDRAVELIKTGN